MHWMAFIIVHFIFKENIFHRIRYAEMIFRTYSIEIENNKTAKIKVAVSLLQLSLISNSLP